MIIRRKEEHNKTIIDRFCKHTKKRELFPKAGYHWEQDEDYFIINIRYNFTSACAYRSAMEITVLKAFFLEVWESTVCRDSSGSWNLHWLRSKPHFVEHWIDVNIYV